MVTPTGASSPVTAILFWLPFCLAAILCSYRHYYTRWPPLRRFDSPREAPHTSLRQSRLALHNRALPNRSRLLLRPLGPKRLLKPRKGRKARGTNPGTGHREGHKRGCQQGVLLLFPKPLPQILLHPRRHLLPRPLLWPGPRMGIQLLPAQGRLRPVQDYLGFYSLHLPHSARLFHRPRSASTDDAGGPGFPSDLQIFLW